MHTVLAICAIAFLIAVVCLMLFALMAANSIDSDPEAEEHDAREQAAAVSRPASLSADDHPRMRAGSAWGRDF